MEQQIFNILFNQDEITWQSLLMDLVKSEGMDIWNIDLSVLTKKYIEIIKEMKKADLRISGKVVLAAAILLRIKSQRLLTEDIAQFDNLMNGNDEDLLYEEEGHGEAYVFDRGKYKKLRLIPRTPQPRARKVSIYDLLDALKRALDVEEKRRLRIPKKLKFEMPEKKLDITELMTKVYIRILGMYNKAGGNGYKISFSNLVIEKTKMGKIHTFIPLLHLTNQRKIDLEQEKSFGEIDIRVIKENIDRKIQKEAEAY